MATSAALLRVGPLPDDTSFSVDVVVVAVATAIFLDDVQLKYTVGLKQIGGVASINFIKPHAGWQDNGNLSVAFSIETVSGDKYLKAMVSQGVDSGSFYWSGSARCTAIRSVGELET